MPLHNNEPRVHKHFLVALCLLSTAFRDHIFTLAARHSHIALALRTMLR